MAKAFNLTAQLNLTGPNNLKPIVSKIKKELGSIKVDAKFDIDTKASKAITDVKNRLSSMNAVLVTAKKNTNDLNTALKNLSTSLGTVKGNSVKVNASVNSVAKSASTTAKSLQQASSQMEEFGRQGFLAVKRFAAFSIVAGSIYKLVNAVTDGVRSFISFDKQLVRLEQVTGDSAIGIKALSNEITNLSVTLGVNSESLTEVAVTLAQAGLTANQTKQALSALAKSELAPSFDNITDTTEGAIAAMRQFGIASKDLEKALGSINAVAAGFAVESSDIIAAIQRAGGAFAASSTGVASGIDSLNQFIAVFTSVRATTRESAETIATGLRTIFTRIQRPQTIEFLKQFGVELTDLDGKFVGPYEAVRRLSTELNKLDPRDLRFAQIVEELGGFRQISKVIPLIQQFATAEEALKVAQEGQASLAKAQEVAQKSLAVRLAKVREEFLALIKTVAQSNTFQGFFNIVVGLSSALLKLANAFKPLLPALAILGTIKGGKAITEFAGGFFGAFKKGGGVKGAGTTLGSTITGSKDTATATSMATEALKNNTTALTLLTTGVNNLIQAIKSGKPSTLNGGGPVRAFAGGGYVPGSGNRDTVPAMLTPGEFVIRKKAVETIGAGALQKMNKYAEGGPVQISEFEQLRDGAATVKASYSNRIQPQDQVKGSINRSKINFNDKNSPIDWEQLVKDTDRKYSELKEKSPQETDTYRLLNQASSLAFEEAVQKIVGGKTTDLSYPVDIIRPKKTPIEVKFTKDPVSIKELLSKLYRYRAVRKSLNRYPFTTDIDNNPPVDIGRLDVVEMGPGQKELYNSWYGENKDKILNQYLGGKIQKFAGGGKALGARPTIKELDETELAQLSTPQLIQYAKDLAYDVFTTGGAGMAIGSEFIEVPKEKIIPELESSLVSYMGKRGFWREKVAPFGRAIEQKATSTSKLGREAALQSQVSRYADEVAARSQEWTSIRSGSSIDNYLMQSLQEPILSDYQTSKSGQPLAKTFHSTRLRQAVNKALDEFDDFDYSGLNIDKLVSGMAAKRFAFGGPVSADSGFEAIQKKIMDQYPDINFRISKRKGGFGYNVLGGLKQEGDNVGNYAEFKQAGNLSKLQEVADKMASSLLYEYGPNIDPSLLKKMQKKKFANGGSTQDTVPALLTPGEFVINKKAAQKIGYAKLNKMNKADKIQGFNKGGSVGGIQRFATGGAAGTTNDPRTIAALEDAARRAGLSLQQFEKQLRLQTIAKSLNKIAELKTGRGDLRTQIIKATATGLGDRKSRKELATQLSERLKNLNPSAKIGDINKAIGEIFKGIKNGQTFDDMLKSTSTSLQPLKDALDDTTDNTRALKEAQNELVSEFGGLTTAIITSIRDLETANYKQSGQAEQDFGLLGNLFTKQALDLKQTKTGSGLLNAANKFQTFGIEGANEALAKLPGPIGEAVKAIGGFPGVVSAATGMLGQFISEGKYFVDNVFAAGITGLLTEAGSQALSMGTIGQQLLGPIGGMIGTIGGAVAGAIEGYISGTATKRLELQLRELSTATENANIALDNLSKVDTEANYKEALKNVGALRASINTLQSESQSTFGERAGMGVAGATQGGVVGGIGAAAAFTAISTFAASVSTSATGIVYGLGAIAGAIASIGALPVIAVGAAVAALGYGIYRFAYGISETDKAAFAGSLKAIEEYVKGINQLAERRIKLTSLADITANIKAYEKATTPEARVELGKRSAQVKEAIESAKIRNEDTQKAADDYAKALAMDELNRQFNNDTEVVRRQAEKKGDTELIRRGYELAAAQNYQLELQSRMTAAMKEVNLQTESLTELFDKMSAATEKFGVQMERSQFMIDEMADAMGGMAKVGTVSRINENVLKNSGAYSQQEFNDVVSRVGALAGGGVNADKLTQSLQAKRIVEQSLPDILRGTSQANVNEVGNQIESLFKQAGISGDTRDELVKQITEELNKETQGRQGKSFKELAEEFPALQKAMQVYDAANEAATNILKEANDQLSRYSENLNKINDAIVKNLELSTRADQIRYDTAVQLDEILKTRLSKTGETTKEKEIRRLATQGGAGNTLDPAIIGSQLNVTFNKIREIRDQRDRASIDENRKLLEEEAALSRQANFLNKALEELANNTERTARIMNEFQEYEQVKNQAKDFARRVFTAGPEERAEIFQELKAATKLMDGIRSGNLNPAILNNPEFARQAYAGVDMLAATETQKEALRTTLSQALLGITLTPQQMKELRAAITPPDLDEPPTWATILTTKIEEGYTRRIKAEEEVRLGAIEELSKVQKNIQALYTEQNTKLISALDKLTLELNSINTSPPPGANSSANQRSGPTGTRPNTNNTSIPSVSIADLEQKKREIEVKIREAKEAKQLLDELAWDFSTMMGWNQEIPYIKHRAAANDRGQLDTELRALEAEIAARQNKPTTPNNLEQEQQQLLDEYIKRARENAAQRAAASTPTGTPPIPKTTAKEDRTPSPSQQPAPAQTTGLLSLDDNTKNFLTGFQKSMDNFGSYINKMDEIVNRIPKIPERIEMQGRHTVQVTITGDKVWETLEPRMMNLIKTEVDNKMRKTWEKTGGEVGSAGVGGRSTYGAYIPE